MIIVTRGMLDTWLQGLKGEGGIHQRLIRSAALQTGWDKFLSKQSWSMAALLKPISIRALLILSPICFLRLGGDK